MFSKILQKIKENQLDVILSVVIILITIISFQSGKIYALKDRGGERVAIKEAPLEEIFVQNTNQTKDSQVVTTSPANSDKLNFTIIASKNSIKYHFLWCSGASKISDKNKITFPTEAAAIAAGLTLASNCKK